MSLGGFVGPGADDNNCGNRNGDAVHRAICRSVAASVTYVVAAGNSGDTASQYVPAAYNEVITVSALAYYNGRPLGGAAIAVGVAFILRGAGGGRSGSQAAQGALYTEVKRSEQP